MRIVYFISLNMLFGFASNLLAEELLDAERLLQQIRSNQEQVEVAVEEGSVAAAIGQYRGALKQQMEPAAQAKKWAQAMIALYNRDPYVVNEEDIDVAVLFEQMPSPAAWPHLSTEFAAIALPTQKAEKEEPAQQGFMGRLVQGLVGAEGDEEDGGAAYILKAIPMVLSGDTESLRKLFFVSLPEQSDDYRLAQVRQSVLEFLVRHETNAEELLKLLQFYLQMVQNDEHGNNYHFLSFPDLTVVLNKEQAEHFSLQLLQADARNLDFEDVKENPFATLCLATLEKHRDVIKQPHWSLLERVDATKAFELTEKKFDQSNKDEYSKHQFGSAFSYYLIGLMVSGRFDDAKQRVVSILKKRKSTDWMNFYYLQNELAKHGLLESAYTILHSMIEAGVDNIELWDEYIEIAARIKKLDEVVEQLRARLVEQQGEKTFSHLAFATALLGVGKKDEALSIIDEMMSDDKLTDEIREELVKKVIKLAWVYDDRGYLAYAFKHSGVPDHYYATSSLVRVSLAKKAYAQLQAYAIKWLKKSVKKSNDQHHFSSDKPGAKPLSLLARIYLEQGRVEDALYLVEHAEWWGVDDAVDLAFERYSDSPMRVVDWAHLLQAKGETSKAIAVMQYALFSDNNEDDNYQMYLKLEMDVAKKISFMKLLAKADPYQERPLIWQADMLIGQKKFKEALAVCERAVAIDPSDGEQGQNKRMRVYALMAQCYEGLGDASKTAFFKKVVASIRLSEKADKVAAAGMHNEAIAMYREGLTLFSDAYCIQTRLASRLLEQGRWNEAEQHYRKAFELMPDSFGRMESHCFGCEGAFKGPKVQTLAEKVFAKRIERDPFNPRVHYLLAYLRIEQARYKEAYKHLQEAVKLDPEYINAWKKMYGIRYNARLSVGDISKIQLQLLRLDPMSQHTHIDSFDFDLAGVWKTVAELEVIKAPPRPESILRFTAYINAPKDHDSFSSFTYFGDESRDRMPSPGEVVFNNRVLKAIREVVNH